MSLNTAAIRLSIELGEGQAPENSNWLKAKAGRAMLHQDGANDGADHAAAGHGVRCRSAPPGVKMIEHASAYATFANGGKRVPPYATISVTNGRGDIIYDHERDEPKPAQIFDPAVIDEMNTMLRQVVLGGTGRAADIPGLPVAGKTGTTNGYHDAWFMGCHRQFRLRPSWYGNDDYAPMRDKDDGRLDPGAHLARHHVVCPGERRTEAGARPAGAGHAAGRRRQRPRRRRALPRWAARRIPRRCRKPP